jgi:hypothetical protein
MNEEEKIKVLVQALAHIVREDRFYTYAEIQCSIAHVLGFTEKWIDDTLTKLEVN